MTGGTDLELRRERMEENGPAIISCVGLDEVETEPCKWNETLKMTNTFKPTRAALCVCVLRVMLLWQMTWQNLYLHAGINPTKLE